MKSCSNIMYLCPGFFKLLNPKKTILHNKLSNVKQPQFEDEKKSKAKPSD